jgi:hypothetical protein
MYAELIKNIESEKVKRNNILSDPNRCGKGTEAAIKALSSLDATVFVKTLFDTSLVVSKAIVDAVKAGLSIYDAYITATTK